MNNKTQGETEEQIIAEEIKKEKIRRHARKSHLYHKRSDRGRDG